MTTSLLKTRINRKINKLPHNKLQVVEDFVSYLSERDDENEATKELISIPGFENRFKEALRSVKKGETIDWETIKRNV